MIMVAKESAAARKIRFAMLLADYDARSRELRKITKEVETLKAQVKDIVPGTYGDFVLSHGTAREIVDQQAIKTAYAARGEQLPTKMTSAPVIVTPKVSK